MYTAERAINPIDYEVQAWLSVLIRIAYAFKELCGCVCHPRANDIGSRLVACNVCHPRKQIIKVFANAAARASFRDGIESRPCKSVQRPLWPLSFFVVSFHRNISNGQHWRAGCRRRGFLRLCSNVVRRRVLCSSSRHSACTNSYSGRWCSH